MRSSSRSSVKMSHRNWVECDLVSSSAGSGFDTDQDSSAESGISACSSVASIDDCLGGSFREERMFRIATYNILTDKCINQETYLYCPEEIRYMNGRHSRIVAEIRSMNPDVICLQEVDYNHYETRLKRDMQQMGYTGVLHERLDDQGLAVFWKDAAFQLVQQKHCLLHHLAESHIQVRTTTSTSFPVPIKWYMCSSVSYTSLSKMCLHETDKLTQNEH